jgi:hypothetical protein
MKRFKEIFEEYREEIRKNGAGSLYDESFFTGLIIMSTKIGRFSTPMIFHLVKYTPSNTIQKSKKRKSTSTKDRLSF